MLLDTMPRDHALILLIMGGLAFAIWLRVQVMRRRRRQMIADFIADPERQARQGSA